MIFFLSNCLFLVVLVSHSVQRGAVKINNNYLHQINIVFYNLVFKENHHELFYMLKHR